MIRLCIVYFITSLVGILLQATLAHANFPSMVAPDLVLVVTVLLALQYRTVFALCGAFVLGLLMDFASGQYIGPAAAGSVLAFMMVGSIASRVYADRMIAIMLITFLCSLLKSSVQIGMIAVYMQRSVLHADLINSMFLEALFSAVCAPIVLKIVLWGRKIPARSSSSATATGSFRISKELV